jgi:hypothetical protein
VKQPILSQHTHSLSTIDRRKLAIEYMEDVGPGGHHRFANFDAQSAAFAYVLRDELSIINYMMGDCLISSMGDYLILSMGLILSEMTN